MSDVVNARVKWYNIEKGYGFLTVDGHEKDIFVHVKKLRNSGILGNLVEGEFYQCTIENGPKGLFATNLTKTNAPEAPR